ncbi:MAG: DUF6468 domain-containing protein [Amaricoccus sp.]|uniref:DUF6468 domain-containing protein n=1 Tax=Amaricoccus sp. TaxID=1872485 RepID=UPI0039E31278
MDLLMNGLLLAATCFAGTYCWVLARRVRDLKSLDKGLGGAIVTLTRQVELARTTLEEARTSSRDTRTELSKMVQQADTAANQLRLLIAAAPHAAPVRPAPAPAPAPAPMPAEMSAPVQAPIQAAAPAPAPTPEATPDMEAGEIWNRREPLLTAPAPSPAFQPAAPELVVPQLRLAPRPKAVVPPSIVPDLPEAEPEEAPLAIPTLDRMVAGPLARPRTPEVEAVRTATPHLAEVPKPRALTPIENPLRRLRAAAARAAAADAPKAATPTGNPTGNSEDALLEALSALAGGR